MRLRLISPAGKLPTWVDQGFEDYRRRLPPELDLTLVDVALGKRGKGSAERAMAEERDRIRSKLDGELVIALDQGGERPDSPALAGWLERWLMGGRDVALLVGGPDGLHPDLIRDADQRWSLSPLTLPHGLVRVVLAEQLYRAWSIRSGHPYHRV